MFELVKTTTADELSLSGLLISGAKDKVAMIYIHGFEGDFYSHTFIKSIAEEFKKHDMTFLSVQTRGTGQRSWFQKSNGESKYIGSHFEVLSEAFLDIDAWVSYLSMAGYKKIVVAGHSLGTLKAVRYLYEGSMRDKVRGLILLCPFDKNGQENLVTEGQWRNYLKIAKEKISEKLGNTYIPQDADNPWEEIEMTYQTFYSWYFEDELGCMFDLYRKAYNFPILNKIQIPVHVIVGTKDEFFHRTNPDFPKEGMQILLNNLKQGTGRLIANATHNFKGYEETLVEEILEFTSSMIELHS